MGSWLYRLIVAVLTFLSGAALGVAARILGDLAHRLAGVAGDGLVIAAGVLAAALMITGFFLLLRASYKAAHS